MKFDPDTQITSDDQLYLKEGKINKQDLLWTLLNKKIPLPPVSWRFHPSEKCEISITHSKQCETPYPSDLVTNGFLRQDHFLNTSKKAVTLRIPKQIEYGFSLTLADSSCQLGSFFSHITWFHDSNAEEVQLSCCSLGKCLPDCSQVFTDISALWIASCCFFLSNPISLPCYFSGKLDPDTWLEFLQQ